MRWQIFVAALTMMVCVWADGAEDKPTTARLSLEDSVGRLEREEAAIRETMDRVTFECDSAATRAANEADANTKDELSRKYAALVDMGKLTQIRLNDVREHLRQARSEELQQAFGEECTLTVTTDKEPIRIEGVSLVKVLNVAGRQMLQFRSKSDGTLWTIDPQRIVMAQITR